MHASNTIVILPDHEYFTHEWSDLAGLPFTCSASSNHKNVIHEMTKYIAQPRKLPAIRYYIAIWVSWLLNLSYMYRSSVLVPITGTAESAGMWPIWIGQWLTENHKKSQHSKSPGSQNQKYWHTVEGYCESSSQHWWVQVGRECVHSARSANDFF